MFSAKENLYGWKMAWLKRRWFRSSFAKLRNVDSVTAVNPHGSIVFQGFETEAFKRGWRGGRQHPPIFRPSSMIIVFLWLKTLESLKQKPKGQAFKWKSILNWDATISLNDLLAVYGSPFA